MLFFLVKQNTAYEMRISDWSSDVCSSDLLDVVFRGETDGADQPTHIVGAFGRLHPAPREFADPHDVGAVRLHQPQVFGPAFLGPLFGIPGRAQPQPVELLLAGRRHRRSEEHTSELQSLMRISYAVFCLKKKHTDSTKHDNTLTQV